MSVYKRGTSKYYWVKFYDCGKLVRQSAKTANKRDAEQYERDLRAALRDGRIGIEKLGNKADKPLVFKDAMQAFLDNLEVKESTKRRYDSASKALLTFFHNAIVTTIKAEDVQRFKNWRKKQTKKPPARLLKLNPKAKTDTPIAPASINREIMLLSGLFSYLLQIEKIKSHPIKGKKGLRLEEDNEQNRVVTDQEFRAYLMACSQPLRDVAVIMHSTGMRPVEIFNLTKENVDFSLNRIIITSGKTKAAIRNIPMTDSVRMILQNRFDNAMGNLLFPGGRKGDKETPIVKLTNAHLAAIERVNKAVKETGKGIAIKPFRLYDLRHTFATHLTRSPGVDLVTVSALLGHSRLEMLKRYSHTDEEQKANAITRLEDFRNQDSNVKAFRRTA